MITFDECRKDKEFKIDSLNYQEIFEGLKSGIEKTIRKYDRTEGLPKGLRLEERGCQINFAYGKDKDMYPKITIEVSRLSDVGFGRESYYFIFNPFEIVMVCERNGAEICIFQELTQALIGMMNEKFPDSDYKEKREKYFKMAELIRKKQEEMLFF